MPRRAACVPPRGGTGCRRSRVRRRRWRRRGAESVRATTRKPSGTAATASPWLIHTCSRAPTGQMPSKSAQGSTISRNARPNSRRSADSTAPPHCRAHRLLAVADAEERDAEAVDALVGTRRLVLGERCRPARQDDAAGREGARSRQPASHRGGSRSRPRPRARGGRSTGSPASRSRGSGSARSWPGVTRSAHQSLVPGLAHGGRHSSNGSAEPPPPNQAPVTGPRRAAHARC